eukprot:TRINITY_DN1095_c0_g1_i1.p1 TRINITY_DN1095_c0_g1~~TRINITY_DN1095_c0_g1_i1.p1  ORF type:complete len:192 (+),score=50.75 TRINITY_DN1095_c0_g1_i1:177-752(+)
MEYMQQKTPFIERWEKAMEEMLNKGEIPSQQQALLSYPPEASLLALKKDDGQRRAEVLSKEDEEEEKDHEKDEGEGKKKRKKPEVAEDESLRKELHNATEKRRREKINTKLEELKQLIPHCKNTTAQKAAILSQAIEYIKTLVTSYNEQVELNKKLQDTNNLLHSELKELHQSLWQRDKIFLSNLQQFRGY